MSPLRPTTTSSSASSAPAGVSPVALLVCVLATIVAVPVLLSASDRSDAEEVAVVAVDETVTESGLEPDIDMDALFDAGARIDSVPRVAADDDLATPVPTRPSLPISPEAAMNGDAARVEAPAAAVEPDTSSTISDTPATAAPPPTTAAPSTTVPPTTAAAATAPPSTAPPTTAPPTTASPTTAPPTTAPPTTAAPATEQSAPNDEPEPAAPLTPTPDQWAALRHCESSGSYTVVSSNGLYHGAYQFYQPTWDGLARQAGRTDLVGLPPSQASPADQDALALLLWQQRGPQPWPVCGRHLPPLP